VSFTTGFFRDHYIYFVYAILCKDKDSPGYMKIGHSFQPWSRLMSMNSKGLATPKFIALSKVGREKSKAQALEVELHGRFAHRLVRGEREWFEFDFANPDDKAEFNNVSLLAMKDVLGDGHSWWKVLPVRPDGKLSKAGASELSGLTV